MKQFFYISFFLLSFTSTASAQTPEEMKAFVAQRFLKEMPQYVLQNTEIVEVTKKVAKKYKGVYLYTDANGTDMYQGYIRTGDTLFVYGGEPFYSTGQHRFIAAGIAEQKVAKGKTRKVREPKSPEQKARTQEVLGRVIGIVVPAVVNKVGNGSVGYQPNMIN